ncbi:MAG: hypothetical protein AB1760_18715 [Pseudomonadota bacterium]
MSATPGPIAAVHYAYFLKQDEQALSTLWKEFTAEEGRASFTPPPLDLGIAEDGVAGYCRMVQRIRGDDIDFCLVMLADLSVLQIVHHSPGGTGIEENWRQAGLQVAADRERFRAHPDITLFGETTVYVFDGEDTPEFHEAAAALAGEGRVLAGGVDPSLGGGGRPLLLKMVDHGDAARDLYALAAYQPEGILSTMLPKVDSLIKKLSRAAVYFREQRGTIVEERSGVDREVGTLLHRQVVAAGEEPDAAKLEEQIGALSRMFGLLATDSLLVRQAADRLERDINQLRQELDGLLEAGADDEIGAWHLSRFGAELEAARDEAATLDMSRQSAQAAIEVVRTQVELLRAGEEAAIQTQMKQLLTSSLLLQKERVALQVAAGFVEFVLVFYYVLKSWEGVAGLEPVEHLSPWVRLVTVGSFSAAAALGTHFLAQTLQSGKWSNRWLWLSVAVLILSFTAMVLLTVANY